MKIRTLMLAAPALLITLFGNVAARADAVTNGNFATGDFTGWTLGGDTSLDAVYASENTTDPSGPGFGNSAFLETNYNGDTTLSQTLSTVAGTSYTLSFFLQADGPGSFTTLIDGNAVSGLSTIATGAVDWVFYNYQFSATGNDTLEFDAVNDTAAFELTNVSAAAVPEPTTWALMVAGLVGLGYIQRRRGRFSANFV